VLLSDNFAVSILQHGPAIVEGTSRSWR
jgi:hypothetical protein